MLQKVQLKLKQSLKLCCLFSPVGFELHFQRDELDFVLQKVQLKYGSCSTNKNGLPPQVSQAERNFKLKPVPVDLVSLSSVVEASALFGDS